MEKNAVFLGNSMFLDWGEIDLLVNQWAKGYFGEHVSGEGSRDENCFELSLNNLKPSDYIKYEKLFELYDSEQNYEPDEEFETEHTVLPSAITRRLMVEVLVEYGLNSYGTALATYDGVFFMEKSIEGERQKSNEHSVVKADFSDVECVKDFENGYTIQMMFANLLSDGSPGDIYASRRDVKREHPHDGIVTGYCVVNTADGLVPDRCNDWNDTVAEAIADYTDNVIPFLEIRDVEVHSWEDMDKKYPMGREEMSEEEEAAFVEDCFKLYESEGFSPKFWSPYGDYKDKFGQFFDVVGRCTKEQCSDPSVLPMWNIRFADGSVVGAYPEEIVPSEMKENGCKWFEGVLSLDDSEAVWQTAGFDVASPQEVADLFGKAVRDGNRYFLPAEKDLTEKMADASSKSKMSGDFEAYKATDKTIDK